MQIAARDFVEQMTVPMWQALAAVRWLEGRVPNIPKVEETSPAKAALTDGDCVSQEILVTALRGFFPRVELDAEEDTPTVLAFAENRSEYTACVDPIDGTLRYLQGDGLYAILLGLERGGVVEGALVAIPQEDVLIRAVRGEGAELARAGGEFVPARLDSAGSRLLVSADLPPDIEGSLRARGFAPQVAAGGAIGVAPLLEGTLGGLRTAQKPQGLSRRAWIATLPVREAGGAVETLDGPFPVSYRKGIPLLLVASAPPEIERIRSVLR